MRGPTCSSARKRLASTPATSARETETIRDRISALRLASVLAVLRHRSIKLGVRYARTPDQEADVLGFVDDTTELLRRMVVGAAPVVVEGDDGVGEGAPQGRNQAGNPEAAIDQAEIEVLRLVLRDGVVVAPVLFRAETAGRVAPLSGRADIDTEQGALVRGWADRVAGLVDLT